MSLADDLAAGAAHSVRRARPEHPKGWEPGLIWGGNGGTITTQPLEGDPDWRSVIEAFELNPDHVEIIEPVQFRTWDAAVGNGEVRRMRYWRANVRSRRPDALDVGDLIAGIRKRRPRPIPTEPVTGAFVYAAADWQAGKKGTDAMVERVLRSYDDAAARIRELRKIGRRIDAIYFLGLGDLHEGCKDHYAMQPFEVELDNRGQARLVRELWSRGTQTFAALAPRVVCAAIGGNHGEERHKGKAYTTFADNKDVASVEAVAERYRDLPGYEHVSWVIPESDLTLTLDVAGAIVGLAHGHQANRARHIGDLTPTQGKIREWWKDQTFGRRPVGDADILLTGHYHHYAAVSDGGRTHLQAPTMDSGSQWWEETAGMPTNPGALTFMVSNGRLRDVELL